MGLTRVQARTPCGTDRAAWLEYIRQLHDRVIGPGRGW